LRPHLHRLPLLGIVPSFVLASYSLTQPWAKARIVMLWGISRSPEAVTLVIAALGGMLAASVAVALRGDRLRIAGWVHLFMGLAMCVVAGLAFRYISHSGLKFLFIPIASVKPGRGLMQFVIASLLCRCSASSNCSWRRGAGGWPERADGLTRARAPASLVRLPSRPVGSSADARPRSGGRRVRGLLEPRRLFDERRDLAA
jgi:hypothetical protein